MRYLVLVALMGCRPSSPTPGPSTAAQIAGELVDAGCLAPGAGDVDAVSGEMALPNPPAWLTCLEDSGTIAGCNVPCSKP